MNIAYINCLVSKHGLLGVEKKLLAQAKTIASLGLNMEVFHFDINRKLQDTRLHFFRQGGGRVPRRLSVFHRYSCISKHVDTDRYDILVLRYSGADFSAFSRFFRNCAGRIVTEHHSKELPEAYTYDTTLPQKVVTLLMERFLGPRIIRKCVGLIGVTDEIKEYELLRAGISIPACTIPNGVLVQDVPFSRHAAYNGKVLNLLCLANAFGAWHGLDRVLAGLQNYASRKPFLHLSVVGDVSPQHLDMANRLLHNVHVEVEFLGRLYGRRLEAVFEKTHVAFSSLALFRNGMKDACVLKTREFMARGLPFAIGYHDPDLENTHNYVLCISPDDAPVKMDHIVSFAERILNRNGVSGAMRQFAQERLDWKIKMQQMWSFLESLGRQENTVVE